MKSIPSLLAPSDISGEFELVYSLIQAVTSGSLFYLKLSFLFSQSVILEKFHIMPIVKSVAMHEEMNHFNGTR